MRARLGVCRCGQGLDTSPAYSYLKCADEGDEGGRRMGCEWTPWSEPSAEATPTLATVIGEVS